VHFAFDQMKNEAEILRGLRTFAKFNAVNPRRAKVYILVNYDATPEEDWYRVRKVRELGFRPDVRIYQKGTQSQFLTDLARWACNDFIFYACPSFGEFIPRKRGGGKPCRALYERLSLK
jgi:hypothetical protein